LACAASSAWALGNTSGYDSGNKDATITLYNHFYYGNNTVAMKTSGGAVWKSVRNTIGKTTGKWVFEATLWLMTDPASFLTGPGNTSAILTDYIGSTANGFGKARSFIGAAQANNFWNNGSSIQTNGDTWDISAGSTIMFAIDLDNGRISYTHDHGVTWCSAAACGIDPTTGGTSISSLGAGTIYSFFSFYSDNTTKASVNNGGWPFLTPVPSGFSGPDAGYPASIPTSTVSFNAASSNLTRSQNNMRVTVGTVSGSSFFAARASKNIPVGSKVMWEFIVEGSDQHTPTNSVALGLLDPATNIATASIFDFEIYGDSGNWSLKTNGSGTVTGSTGVPINVGDIVQILVDMVGNNLWVSVNGGNWNGNASANPGVNTTGAIDISDRVATTWAPMVKLNNETIHPAVSANFGAITMSRSIPSGFVSLENATADTGGAYHIFGQWRDNGRDACERV
jgi:hypothetical protein